MTRLVPFLAVLYVALVPFGRSGLPLNAQWGDLLFPVLAWAVWRSGLPGAAWRRHDWPLAFYLLVTLGATLVSTEPRVGLAHFFKQAYVAAVFLVFRRLAENVSLTKRLQMSYVFVFTAITAFSIGLVLLRTPSFPSLSLLGAVDTLPFLGVVPRLRSALLTPEMLGNGLLVAFVLALAHRSLSEGRARVVWTLAVLTLAVGEFFTFSHSVAGFASAFGLFAAASHTSRAVRAAILTGALLVVAAVNAASLVEPGPVRNDHGVGQVSIELPFGSSQGELNHYAALKLVAWSAFLREPVTGVGPGRFAQATEQAFQEGRLTARYRHKPAQCDLLGRLAETGVFGGLSLLCLWASWLRPGLADLAAMDPVRRAAFAAVVGLLVNSVNADVMNFRFLWLAVAWASVPKETTSI